MASLTLQAVAKQFGSVDAVNAIDLEIADGELIVLVGPSGCGKSTLLRMIAGLEEISSGEILLDGQRLNDTAPRDRDMAMVFQDYALYPHMTVAENLGFGLTMRNVPASEREESVARVAQMLELEPLLGRKPKALSGGQRQRVALGRALIRDPKVFLFDEPLSNLDAKLRVGMRMEIRKLQMALKTTSIYVTHDQVEAMTIADRIVVLKSGEVQQVGVPSEIYRSPANSFVGTFIGSPPMSLVKAELSRRGEEVRLVFGQGQEAILPPKYAASLNNVSGVSSVMVGLRPEHVGLAGPEMSSSASFVFSSKVMLVEDHGADSLALISLGEQEVLARIGHEDIRTGELGNQFQIDMQRIHLFSFETGAAII